ncbi:MAG: autotransporter assembly complex family protein [Arenibacterium sp.]
MTRVSLGCRRVGNAALLLCLALLAQPLAAFESRFAAPGAPDNLAKNLRVSSSLLSAEANNLTTTQELLAAALADYRTMVQVLYDAGFFSPRVSIRLNGREASQISLIQPPSNITSVDIRIEPGPPFRFGQIRVAPLAPGTELPEGFASGQPASTGALRRAAAAGVDQWRATGHAKARIGSQRIVANHTRNQIDADIEIIPDRKMRFGQLVVEGNRDVRTDAILVIAGMPTNRVYSPEDAQKVGSRLRRSGAFKSVSLTEADQANPDGSLDFTATVVEQLPRRFTFGAELESRDGLKISGSWLHRNLFGGAERFRFQAEIGNIGGSQDIEGSLSFRLDDPTKLGADNNLFYYGAIDRLDREHYTLNRAVLGVGARRIVNNDLVVEAALEISRSEANDAFGSDRRFELVSLPMRAELDRRDSEQNATQGYFVDLRLTPFSGFSGSESGAQATFDGRGYFSLTDSGSIVLAGRLQLGSVVGPSLPNVSPDLLFFSGGASTVRGQPFESLGVPVGNKIAGGRSILAASAEVRAQVVGAISVVGFYDFAAVDADSFVNGSSPNHAGAGIGLRYDLGGFGPVRLDVALPVSGPTNNGLQFYLGIGQAF